MEKQLRYHVVFEYGSKSQHLDHLLWYLVQGGIVFVCDAVSRPNLDPIF